MSETSPRTVHIRQEPIELSQLLKFAGVVETGGDAKQAIANGLVQLNGKVETQKAKKIKAGDQVTYEDHILIVQVGG